ncbi:YciI family protein [Ruixingdingia sedimenti]|uniref:YciI family protein n=1 Tax=Ruixingdingia sedimenti TaxID=3073604 RepID=A0ABU1F6I2_9RHOB|nr:YciI family protein [Xinfangfangia sp. LG-4]MDR5652477.1 YciI family protein [Xinfangfangia sp. LG-4]
MLYAIICRDKPGALQLRLDTRPAHLAYLEETGVVRIAGPFIEDDRPVGSLVIVETADRAAAEAFAANDPYARAGLFAEVTVNEWKRVIG